MSQVIVIGSGAGGLSAAIRLRNKGHSVTVLEQSATFGGKLARYERDGFVFDTGPSLFTLPAVYRDLFLKSGAALEEVVDLQPIDPGFTYHFHDGSTLTMPGVDPGMCAAAIGRAFGGNSEAEWRTFMQRAAAMWRITRVPVIESPLNGMRDLASLAKSPRDIRTIAPFTSLHSLARKTFSDPRLVTLVDRYATYTGSDPRKAPAVLATIPYVEQNFGAWHLGGGVTTLADALVQRAMDRGVDLRPNTEVTRILTETGRATGVELSDGSTMAADIVVANADASLVYGRLIDDQAAAPARKRLAQATPSMAGFVILLAVEGKTPGLAHHNVWFPEHYQQEFSDIFGRHPRPVRDPAIYACVPDDPRMRPDDDHESWFILVNAPRHGRTKGTIDWDEEGLADRYADHILETLAARGTDIRSRIMWREVRTPSTLESKAFAPGGAIYGTSSNGSRSAFLRAANKSPIEGLFLVGGSAHPGGGLPLVGISGDLVANLIGRAT